MSSSTLEEALRHYLKFFDGHKKEFSPSLRRAFDTIYHKEFYNRTSSKNVISRDRLLQIQQQHLANGTRVLLVSYEHISKSRISYELCIIPPESSSCYQSYRNISEVKDGKIIRPIKSCMREFDATALKIVENKLNTYISVFDGTGKSFSEMEEPFEDLYSSEFIEEVPNGPPLKKQQMRFFITELLFVGTVAQVVSFTPLDGARFKATLHYANDFSNTLVVSTATIKDGKLVSLQTCKCEDFSSMDQASPARAVSLALGTVEDNTSSMNRQGDLSSMGPASRVARAASLGLGTEDNISSSSMSKQGDFASLTLRAFSLDLGTGDNTSSSSMNMQSFTKSGESRKVSLGLGTGDNASPMKKRQSLAKSA